jgi:hypothetical protein
MPFTLTTSSDTAFTASMTCSEAGDQNAEARAITAIKVGAVH